MSCDNDHVKERAEPLYPMDKPLDQFYDQVEYPASEEFVGYLLERLSKTEIQRDERYTKAATDLLDEQNRRFYHAMKLRDRDLKKIVTARNLLQKLSLINNEYYSKQIDLDDIAYLARKCLKDMDGVE